MADTLHWLYQFKPGAERPDLATNAEAWTESDEHVFSAHYERLRQGAEDGKVILAGRSQDGIGPAIVISRRIPRKRPAVSWRRTPSSAKASSAPTSTPSAPPWSAKRSRGTPSAFLARFG